jgi:hypothetical protein
MWFPLFSVALGTALGLGLGSIIVANSEDVRS